MDVLQVWEANQKGNANSSNTTSFGPVRYRFLKIEYGRFC